ncbi:alpha/beta hydrolase [Brevibacillus formosus]|uniref:Carboxylesterase n=1 Tax=Brevibacillus formosus TaxID=54913 RepID=A0A837KJ31_9BACL|nr:alpha/beta hydrolase [Brevibacillus formosus]KLH97747.1 carboxylesterase [Brevibacillus formosus]MED1957450.1 alpha/beta hydrolase [Brevibacillus formosus]PSJ98841.1 alpha/beta hydrolase [Brevibacillus formosus]GED57562.1 putative carboxylesterase nap [Brevibacillus formosus]
MSNHAPIIPSLSDSGIHYYQTYEESLALWPVHHETFYVPTRFGQTHIIASGPKNAPPLLLLHGVLFSSTMWYPNIAEWSSKYRTYAIDIIGDKNKSIPVDLNGTRTGYADWLLEVFDNLGIKKAYLVGLSLGGLHVMNFVLRAAERVEKAVLLSPAETFVSFHPNFYKYALGLFVPNGVENFLKWMMGDRYVLHPNFAKQFHAGVMWQDELRNQKPKADGFPYVFTDDELKSVKVPTLLLLSEHEVIYDPQSALHRASTFVPGIEAEIVKNAGHVLSMEQPEYVNGRVLSFLDK